jgi:hypothetical protein
MVFTLVLIAQFPIRVQAYQEPAAAPAKTDWLQFAFSPDKTANNSSETTINISNVSSLPQNPMFTTPLPAADNPDGAPVFLSDVSTPMGVRDLVFVQGEHGHITAFDGNDGAIVWSRAFGTGGVNDSAPAIDPNRMFIYLDTNDGFVHKLNVGDGSEVTGGGWPENHGGGKGGSELTIATAANGHTYLYAANHGNGHMTIIDVTTGTQHVFNASCSQFPNVQNPGGCTSTGARPWARGNPFIPALDKFFFSTGNNNGNAWNGCNMWKESWLALPADGSTHMAGGCGMPADSWTGTDVVTTVSHDQDIGAGGLTPLPEGLSSKFPHMGVNPGKDHRIRILNLDNLSGQGGPGHQGGEILTFPYSLGSLMRAQSAVWTNPANGQVWIFIVGNSGTHGFTVDVDSAGNPSLNNRWNIQNGWTTSAVVANGVLFTSADGGEHTGSGAVHQVQAINPTTGAMLWTGKIDLFHWESPIVVNGTVYMADGNAGGGFTGPGGHLRAWRIPTGPDFSISAAPPSQTISVGGSASYTVTVGSIGGFNSSVSLALSGTPAGASATFSTNPIPGGSGTSTLTLTTTSTVMPGTYPLTITGTGGGKTHQTPLSLIVGQPDFNVSVSPGSQTVTVGGSTTYTATVTGASGFSGTVSVSAGGLPAGVTVTGCSVTVPPNGSCTLTVTTSATTPTGSHTLTFTGTSSSVSHPSNSVTLTVNPVGGTCVTAHNGGGWVNTPFATQTGVFTVQFDAMPSSAAIGGHVGISHGPGTAYTSFANIVRFNLGGMIDARNDGIGYSADTPLKYAAGATYHVRMVINIPTHHYGVFVTPPEGQEVTIAGSFPFRTEQISVTSLNNYGLFVAATTTNTLQVCNFTVQ